MSEDKTIPFRSDPKPEGRKPIRVLLLDDRQDNLILRSAILRQNGYTAVT